MAQITGSPLYIKSITVSALVTVLLSASISSVATMRFDAMPFFLNLGYASSETSDSSDTSDEDSSSDTNEEDIQKDEEVKADKNGGDKTSNSDSQEQQPQCSKEEVRNEETGECEETQDDNKSKDDEVSTSANSTDPDLCLKTRGQIARAQSQKELDSINIPKQCLASKNNEPDSTQISEEQLEFPKNTDSSSDSNINGKESNGESDKSDSKSKNADPKCLDSTAALMALGAVMVNGCSGDAIPSSNDESQEIKNPITANEQADFDKAYRDGFAAVFDFTESNLVDIVGKLISADYRSSAYRMGVLFGVQAGLIAYDINMEEARLQKDTMDALGIQTQIINITKLKK